MDAVVVSMSAGMVDWLVFAPGEVLSGLTLLVALYGVYHAGFYCLMDGQTPGLASLEIRVVRESGKAMSVPQALLRGAFRPVLVYVLGSAAWHATQGPGMAVSLALAPLLVELGMMFTLPSRQTLSDLAMRSLAVDEMKDGDGSAVPEAELSPSRFSASAAADSQARAGLRRDILCPACRWLGQTQRAA
jgi:uncharacterized RDD family membrane protein YckC